MLLNADARRTLRAVGLLVCRPHLSYPWTGPVPLRLRCAALVAEVCSLDSAPSRHAFCSRYNVDLSCMARLRSPAPAGMHGGATLRVACGPAMGQGRTDTLRAHLDLRFRAFCLKPSFPPPPLSNGCCGGALCLSCRCYSTCPAFSTAACRRGCSFLARRALISGEDCPQT